MKKILALVLAMAMALALVACGGGTVSNPTETPATILPALPPPPVTPLPAATPPPPAMASPSPLWTYPIGNWGDEATVNGADRRLHR